MTNSFGDYLVKYEFVDCTPEGAWECFCEANFARQIGIIDNYARDAFDAGAETEVPGDTHYGMKYSTFSDWKNSND